MSSATLPTVRVLDESVRFHQKKVAVSVVGGRQVSTYSLPLSNGSTATPGQTLTANTTIANTVGVMRTAFFEYSGTFSLSISTSSSGVTTSTPALQAGQFGLSNYPFYKIVSAVTMTIGQYNFNWNNVYNTIDMVSMLKNNFIVDWTWASMSAKLPDNCVNFAQLWNTNKSVLNPWYGAGHGADPTGRTTCLTLAAIPNFTGSGPYTATITGSFDVSTPFLQPPFNSGPKKDLAFVRPGTFQINLTTLPSAANFFSFCPTVAAGGVSITSTITALTIPTATCNFVYQTIDLSEAIPQELQSYNSYVWQYNPQNLGGSIASGGVGTISIQQLNYGIQPESLLLMVRPLASAWTPDVPHYSLPIVGCSINYINSQVLVVSASAPFVIGNTGLSRTLYDISVRNGLSYCDLNQYLGANVGTAAAPVQLSGGMLVLNPTFDLQSGKDVAHSSGTNADNTGYLLSGQLQIYNQTSSTINLSNFELCILALIPQQLFEQSHGSYTQTSYVPNLAHVEEFVSPGVDKQNAEDDPNVSGAGFFSKIAQHVGTAANLFKKYAPAAVALGQQAVGKYLGDSKYAGYANKALDLIQKFAGHGISDEALIDMLRGENISDQEIYDAMAQSGRPIKRSSSKQDFDSYEMVKKLMANGIPEDVAIEKVQEYKANMAMSGSGAEIPRQELERDIEKNSAAMKSRIGKR